MHAINNILTSQIDRQTDRQTDKEYKKREHKVLKYIDYRAVSVVNISEDAKHWIGLLLIIPLRERVYETKTYIQLHTVKEKRKWIRMTKEKKRNK